jgi:hypothetical protein
MDDVLIKPQHFVTIKSMTLSFPQQQQSRLLDRSAKSALQAAAASSDDASLQQQLSSASHVPFIDNSCRFYIPIRLQCGIDAYCGDNVLEQCPFVLDDLDSDLTDCLRLLPSSTHALIRRTRIYLNLTYAYGPCDNPIIVNHATTHHSAGWLLTARDKTQSIEIYNCVDYRSMRLHWNRAGLILHELAHLIHQVVLGLDNPLVIRGYETAKTSGLYETVRRRDWAGKEVDFDLAYATVDCKEFFSEMSVTYFAHGYAELNEKDEQQILECSPPILQRTVLARVRHRWPHATNEMAALGVERATPLTGWMGWLESRFPHFANHSAISHCNKFYPFTKGQLKHYDPDTFQVMETLWNEIAHWKDPFARVTICGIRSCFLPAPLRRTNSNNVCDTLDL